MNRAHESNSFQIDQKLKSLQGFEISKIEATKIMIARHEKNQNVQREAIQTV
jgi:hypothetical protein